MNKPKIIKANMVIQFLIIKASTAMQDFCSILMKSITFHAIALDKFFSLENSPLIQFHSNTAVALKASELKCLTTDISIKNIHSTGYARDMK